MKEVFQGVFHTRTPGTEMEILPEADQPPSGPKQDTQPEQDPQATQQ